MPAGLTLHPPFPRARRKRWRKQSKRSGSASWPVSRRPSRSSRRSGSQPKKRRAAAWRSTKSTPPAQRRQQRSAAPEKRRSASYQSTQPAEHRLTRVTCFTLLSRFRERVAAYMEKEQLREDVCRDMGNGQATGNQGQLLGPAAHSIPLPPPPFLCSTFKSRSKQRSWSSSSPRRNFNRWADAEAQTSTPARPPAMALSTLRHISRRHCKRQSWSAKSSV